MGRKGGGPGEFVSPCCLAIDAKGRLWVRDLGNKRYVVLQLRRGAPFAVPAYVVALKSNAGGYTTRTVFDDAGRVIDAGTDNTTSGLVRITIGSAGAERQRVTLAPPVTGVSAVAKMPKKTPGGQAVYFVYPPFPGYALNATGLHGEAAIAGSGDYRVRWYAGNGSLIREITRTDVGPSVTPDERREADSAMVAEAREFGTTPAALGFRMPARKPVLRNLWFDDDGRLWVELTTARGSARRAHVYSRTGKLESIAEWPANVELSEFSVIRGDEAWSVAHDADEVPTIVRLRFIAR